MYTEVTVRHCDKTLKVLKDDEFIIQTVKKIFALESIIQGVKSQRWPKANF